MAAAAVALLFGTWDRQYGIAECHDEEKTLVRLAEPVSPTEDEHRC